MVHNQRMHEMENQVAKLATGTLGPLESRRLIRHLLRRCQVCQAHLAAELGQGLPLAKLRARIGNDANDANDAYDADDSNDAYDAAISRALDRSLAALPRERVRRKRRSTSVDPELAELRSRTSGIPLVEALLATSFEARYLDPSKMWRFATYARVVATALDVTEATRTEAADVQARAFAELGNACRVIDDRRGAEIAFSQAWLRFARGTRAPSLEARLLELEASFLNTQRKFTDACRLLEKVEALQARQGDLHLAARAVVLRGIYTLYAGDPTTAGRLLSEALTEIDPTRDHELAHSARQSYLWTLVERGQFRAAARELMASGLNQALASSPLHVAKMRWLEGRILAGLGQTSRAENSLRKAWSIFEHHRLAFKAALVGLDLAKILLSRGCRVEVMALTQDITGTFVRLGVAREAQLAVRYLYVACEMNLATMGRVDYVRGFLAQAENDASLSFVYPEAISG